ncbi:dihydroorotate dehydrogenase electron transfer subunit [Slackia heliotrinireducens]|uniref:dihydroorotate dehydrogenase electron transfer subunit n=1 Tax=Slackia heliotrinireducens TaxID=84110 RepID=UPI0033150428
MCITPNSEHFEEKARICSNEQVGPGLFKMVLHCPRSAAAIKPGQFIHMRLDGFEAHILRRPFSVYKADTQEGTMDIIYQVVGTGSQWMTGLEPGHTVSIMAALGNTWQPVDGKLLLVCGGVGAAPLFMFAQQLKAEGRDFEVILGARTADMLVTKADYTALLGREPIIATDDGTEGFSGFATVPMQQQLETGEYSAVYCCGPDPFMRIVSGIVADAGIDCWISEEKRMACGIGACLSCVVETVDGKKRSCVDGPVFNAKDVVWA